MSIKSVMRKYYVYNGRTFVAFDHPNSCNVLFYKNLKIFNIFISLLYVSLKVLKIFFTE